MSRVTGLEFETVPGKYSMQRLLSQVGIHGQLMVNYASPLSSCNISFDGLQDSNGVVRNMVPLLPLQTTLKHLSTQAVTDVVVHPEAFVPTCSQTGFANVTTLLNSMSTLFDWASTRDDFREVVNLANGYVATDEWFSCQTLADSHYINVASIENVTDFTLRCTSTDPSYNSSLDPCCNF